jgi:WD40-like Beta Propeller Repeat
VRRLAVLALLAACGARTGLIAQDGGSPPDAAVTFDAGCAQPRPWLLFDILDYAGTAPGGIYAMRSDGTAGHPVSLPHSPAFFPSVSPDGSKLLYATSLYPDGGYDGGADSALYLYDFASQTSTLDGKTVAYVSGYSLHDIAPDGTNDLALLVGPNNCGTGYGHPVFASDSSTIVYGTGGIIGAIGIDGSGNETLLTAIAGSFQYPNPAFSPDYQRIVMGAFCDQSTPNALRIYAYASLPGATCESGQLLADVSNGAASNMANDPSWSPGGLIAYGSGQDVFVIDASGGTPTNMTSGLTGDGGTLAAADPVCSGAWDASRASPTPTAASSSSWRRTRSATGSWPTSRTSRPAGTSR